MHTRSFEALGTQFTITVWDDLSQHAFEILFQELYTKTLSFDALYSRFKPDSLVSTLSRCRGIHEVPADLVAMLRLYEKLYDTTEGALNPAIGQALEDTGYDAAYSFRVRDTISDTPAFSEAVRILDDSTIELRERVLLDLGALGKGYLIDLLYTVARGAGIQRFLIDGSGDIRYFSHENIPIVCGLEHPRDTTQAIGTLELHGGSLCASAINRRVWQGRHHYLDPRTKESPMEIIATWVYADEAALADGLSSSLFFASPESLCGIDSFEYCMVNAALERKNSAGFAAEFFVS